MTGPHIVPSGPMDNWRQDADAAPPFAQPITVAEWWKNRRGVRWLTLNRYEGRDVLDLHTWYTGDDGKLKPGKGFAAEVRHLPRLAAAFTKAEVKARELGSRGDKGAGEE